MDKEGGLVDRQENWYLKPLTAVTKPVDGSCQLGKFLLITRSSLT